MKRMHSCLSCSKHSIPMVSHSNRRKHGPVRQERKKACARMKSLMRELNRRFVGKGSTSSQRGGVRISRKPKVHREMRCVEGFLETTPDPPKTKSRNRRSSWPPTPNNLPQIVEQDEESPPLAHRAGAPTSSPISWEGWGVVVTECISPPCDWAGAS
jgi:hypothetical protein